MRPSRSILNLLEFIRKININEWIFLLVLETVAAQIETLALFVENEDVTMISGSLGGKWLDVGNDLVALQHILATGNVGTINQSKNIYSKCFPSVIFRFSYIIQWTYSLELSLRCPSGLVSISVHSDSEEV